MRHHINGMQTHNDLCNELAKIEKSLKYALRHDLLVHDAINCREPGVSDKKYCNEEVIVSLTSYSRRLLDVSVTIESIMQGTMKPNRFVLCLEEELKGSTLPLTIQNQQKRGLEILYYKNIRSYLKLIPTLKKYPDAAIMTIDDDMIYDYDLVEKLVNAHITHPKNIVANRIFRIVLGEDKRPLNYPFWEKNSNPKDDSVLNTFTAVGGTLYPPHCLHPEVFNEDVFMDICPHADDIWFYAMALMAGTRVVKAPTRNQGGDEFMINEDVQDMGLFNTNSSSGENSTLTGNDKQLKAVLDKYNLWDIYKDA